MARSTSLSAEAQDLIDEHHPDLTTARILLKIMQAGVTRKDGSTITRDHVRRYQARLDRHAGVVSVQSAHPPDDSAQSNGGKGGDDSAQSGTTLVTATELVQYDPLPGMDVSPQEARVEFLLMIRDGASIEHRAIIKRGADGQLHLERCPACGLTDTRRLDQLSRIAVRGARLIKDAEQAGASGVKQHIHRHQYLHPGDPPPTVSGAELEANPLPLLTPELARGIRAWLAQHNLDFDDMIKDLYEARRPPT